MLGEGEFAEGGGLSTQLMKRIQQAVNTPPETRSHFIQPLRSVAAMQRRVLGCLDPICRGLQGFKFFTLFTGLAVVKERVCKV